MALITSSPNAKSLLIHRAQRPPACIIQRHSISNYTNPINFSCNNKTHITISTNLSNTHVAKSRNLACFSWKIPTPHTISTILRNTHVAKSSENGSISVEEPISEEELESESSNSHRILLSDVIVKRPKNVFKGKVWNALDIATVSAVVGMHGLALLAPFCYSWGAFWAALGLYFATGLLGICLSFHRNLSHRSFKLPKWLEYFCAYCGVLALQGSPINWVSTHRYHHQYCDVERDPHSPLEGFWFSHMNWLFDTKALIQRCGEPSNVGDLEKQGFYRLMRSTYILHPLVLGVLLYAFGGLPYLVWGMGVRTAWVYHITWLVNSACHVWGNQAWNTDNLSRNNWWVALLSFGEGWHNNHHAFEYSAKHGLEWWQVDMTWYTVRILQAMGLAMDVKLPTDAHKQRMVLKGATTTV